MCEAIIRCHEYLTDERVAAFQYISCSKIESQRRDDVANMTQLVLPPDWRTFLQQGSRRDIRYSRDPPPPFQPRRTAKSDQQRISFNSINGRPTASLVTPCLTCLYNRAATRTPT
eukprot:scaffold47868_cov31-Prasinocladus_malaysianus.AAC.1